MTEEKEFKVGEWGQVLGWYMKYDNGDIVTTLDQAESITIVCNLNGTITKDEMTLVDVEEGLIKWAIPEGLFNSSGIAKFEVRAQFSDRLDITNTFKEVIKKNVEN